jgi:hypothetical protein
MVVPCQNQQATAGPTSEALQKDSRNESCRKHQDNVSFEWLSLQAPGAISLGVFAE